MILQEIFDTAVGGVLRQKKKCVDAAGGCAYRSGEMKCAAGFLIPDDLYDPSMESHSFYSLIKKNKFREDHPQTDLLKRHSKIIDDIQIIHDRFNEYSGQNFYKTMYRDYKFLAERLLLNWNFEYEE